jgi:hypothetical protein
MRAYRPASSGAVPWRPGSKGSHRPIEAWRLRSGAPPGVDHRSSTTSVHILDVMPDVSCDDMTCGLLNLLIGGPSCGPLVNFDYKYHKNMLKIAKRYIDKWANQKYQIIKAQVRY